MAWRQGRRSRFCRLRPPPGASLVSFWASRKKPAAGAAEYPSDKQKTLSSPPHPPQCAHWGTFPQGEGFRAAQVCRPYGEREGFRAVRTPPLQKKTGLEKTAGRPLRGTKMGGFSKPCSGVRSPCAYFFENGAPGTARGRGKRMPPEKMVTFCATLRKYFKEILLCNNPDALLRFCYTFL